MQHYIVSGMVRMHLHMLYICRPNTPTCILLYACVVPTHPPVPCCVSVSSQHTHLYPAVCLGRPNTPTCTLLYSCVAPTHSPVSCCIPVSPQHTHLYPVVFLCRSNTLTCTLLYACVAPTHSPAPCCMPVSLQHVLTAAVSPVGGDGGLLRSH